MAKSPAKTRGQEADAVRDVFEEFFNDYYKNRGKVYRLNFVRGIWFGLGSVIGGTLVLAAFFWILSLFHQIPFLTDIVESVQRSIEEARL